MFFTHQKAAKVSKSKGFEKRMESCETGHMFEQLLNSCEEKDHNKNMPVRMFYRNTFADLVNDAIFALKKKQSKETENRELMTCEGSIKFVSQFLLDNLPAGE